MLGRWRIGLTAALLVLACIIVASCSTGRSVPDSQIPGTYQITYEPYRGTVLGTEKLVLQANGTYEQTFKATGGKPWKNMGRWSRDKITGRPMICLHDYKQGLDPTGSHVLPKPTKTNWYSSVDYGYGATKITVDDDNGYYFHKVK